MRDDILRDTLTIIAAGAVPESTDLWPAISRRLAERVGPARRRPDRRRVALVGAAALVAVVALTLVGPRLTGEMSTAQAADVARTDPQVAALLRGDIALVTVTQVVNEVATVVVQDSHGRQVTVDVDLRSRVATIVYEGPELSPTLAARALAIVRADPRTSALIARGAVAGRITPVLVSYETSDPTNGQPTQGSQTWAQVPLELSGQRWIATVDLPQGRIDQLIDPQGQQVPAP